MIRLNSDILVGILNKISVKLKILFGTASKYYDTVNITIMVYSSLSSYYFLVNIMWIFLINDSLVTIIYLFFVALLACKFYMHCKLYACMNIICIARFMWGM